MRDLEATFQLIPIESSLISVDTERFNDLENIMNAMIESDSRYRYSVAWVDSLNKDFRGVLTSGNHAHKNTLPSKLA